MTLAQAKMTKVMKIKGTIGSAVDMTELWPKLYICSKLSITGSNGKHVVDLQGDWGEGLYVLGVIIDAVREAHAHCHLEVSCDYEDE